MKRAAVAVVAALVLPLAACGGSDDDDAYVLRVDGQARVVGEDGTSLLDDGEHRLGVGDRLEVTAGSAVLGLPGDGTLELRAGRRNSTVEVASTPTLIDGDALLDAGDHRARLRAGGADVALRAGSARFRRATGVTVAVYAGHATVEAVGREVDVPAYRQVAVSDAGNVPREPSPLVFDRRNPDPWDQRLLGEAIDLGEQLDRRSLAVDRQLPTTPVTAASLTSLVPVLEEVPDFDDSLVVGTRSLGESLVGASIALDGRGSFVRRWRAAFSFRGAGADWGLVALDQRAHRQALIAVLDGVLRGAPTPFALGGGGDLVASPLPLGDDGGDGDPGTGTRPPDDGDGGNRPPPSDPPSDPPPPTTPLLPDLLDPLLPDPEPEPQAPEDDPDSDADPEPIGDLVGDLGDAIEGLLGGEWVQPGTEPGS